MKETDNDLKKAFRQMDIPEPSEAARKKTVQEAMAAFAQKNAVSEEKEKEKEKKSKGFAGLLRHMGKALQRFISMKGVPIMTQRQFATVGILVIAVGLVVSIGPQVFFNSPSRTSVDVTLPKPGVQGELKDNETRPQIPVSKAENNGPAEADKSAVQTRTAGAGKVSAPSDAVLQEEVKRTSEASVPTKAKTLGRKKDRPAANSLTGFAGASMVMEAGEGFITPVPGYYRDVGRDKFKEMTVNPVKLVGEEPVSTFSIDVDTASYAFVRRQLNSGVLPQKDAVRVEEMINYFDYNYPLPEDRSRPFKPSVALYPTPWNSNTKLLHIGIKGYDIGSAEKPRTNLVFLLDVSGSMNSPDKLPLLKNSFRMLVESMDPDDTVAIAVYAGAAGTVLEPTKVAEKGKILAALEKLQAGGSTAGGEGIRLAYALAEMHFEKDAVNRVILATDGDFNVGITNQQELQSFIERKRDTGIFLSVLGFGQGNYNDALMQTLAQNGNGNAAYIDNLNEARKVLVEEAGSTLFTIARDVKIQIEFNPVRVHDYRLIGYETRLLKREDFNNDKVDAGDIGAGHSVTAIYEITPTESRKKMVDDLRYGKGAERPGAETDAGASEEYAFLKIRYKLPDAEKSKLITMPIGNEQDHDSITAVPKDMQFAAAVAAFGQLLRHDPYTGDFDYNGILQLAEPARGRDQFGYRSEFLNLVRLAGTARAM